ncbi:MAG: pyridoxal-phosphate dependent enzyme [Acidobacteriota bacterium]
MIDRPAPRLTCVTCGRPASGPERRWRCACGGPFILSGSAPLDPEKIEPCRQGLWRYAHALSGVDAGKAITLGEGMTPLVPFSLDGRLLLAKCDFTNPTGSYKDRGWTVAVSRLRADGIDAVVEESSGNAGASLAAYGARAGLAVRVFAPADAPAGKLFQIAAHGAAVTGVEGGRQAVTDACLAAAGRAFYAGHAWNPWFLHGIRTLAWEIAEQLDWTAPAVVFAPVGQGGIILGLHDGFSGLAASGVIDTVPALVGVQAAACAPVAAGLAAGTETPPDVTVRATCADAIRTPAPVRYRQVVAALRTSGGTALAVSEAAIKAAHTDLARAGFFVEPTSAVAAAGAREWLGTHTPHPDRPVVLVLTGHGLKAAG